MLHANIIIIIIEKQIFRINLVVSIFLDQRNHLCDKNISVGYERALDRLLQFQIFTCLH